MKSSARRNLGICVIGAGDISNHYLKAWKKLKGIDLISIADINEERAKKAADRYGIKSWYTDYKKSVDLNNVDIVTVCTPTCLHPEVSIFAANCGKHVLCVKPIALSLEEADRMIEETREKGVKFCVGFMRRFSPVTDRVKKLMSDGTVGRPVLHSIYNAAEIRPKILMHEKGANGGPVIDMCCHYFDIWRVIFDSEPIKVMAQGLIFGKGKKELQEINELAYDTAAIIVTFASGDIGAINITWGLPSGIRPLRQTEELWGSEGVITGLDFSPKEIFILGRKGYKKKITIEKGNASQDSFDLLVEHFVQSIRADKPLSVTGEDGKRALEVSLAALKSIETGKAVDLQK